MRRRKGSGSVSQRGRTGGKHRAFVRWESWGGGRALLFCWALVLPGSALFVQGTKQVSSSLLAAPQMLFKKQAQIFCMKISCAWIALR